MPTQPKIAMVTGASRGLGRNTPHLAERGFDLVTTHRSNAADADCVVTAAKKSRLVSAIGSQQLDVR
jgi:NAD(P)-dependent dehydrogenase (short-subunit alcohol dehydrogenase family)